ncbi:U1 zinc finger protein [Toxoplasma gondii VAND]|uniref:U1 zinc finger protein n=1 Tax=Toxoplasma gondii VAND TaxID=933077 RepID=A0A086PTD2_TOXGO|nr:U1 zinc finger protein [Toxoplasma gondii VAND]
MTERWVSQKKHYCEVCKTWLSGHTMNVKRHEMSERHIMNVRQMFKEMKHREKEREANVRLEQEEIARVEAAAAAAMLREDGLGRPSSSFAAGSSDGHCPPAVAHSGCWSMFVDSSSGLPYFFNSETQESSWTPPPGFPLPPLPAGLLPPAGGHAPAQAAGVHAPAQEAGAGVRPKLKIVSVKKATKSEQGEAVRQTSPQSAPHATTKSEASAAASSSVHPLLPKIKGEPTDAGKSSASSSSFASPGSGPGGVKEEKSSLCTESSQRSENSAPVPRSGVFPAPSPASAASSSVSPSASAAGDAAARAVSFLPSSVFAGKRAGFVFQLGSHGLGYYADSPEESRRRRPPEQGANADAAPHAPGDVWSLTEKPEKPEKSEKPEKAAGGERRREFSRGDRGRRSGGWLRGQRPGASEERRNPAMKATPEGEEGGEETEAKKEGGRTAQSGEEAPEGTLQSDLSRESKAAIGPSIGEWEEVKPGDYSAFGSCTHEEEEAPQDEEEEEPFTEAEYLRDLRWDVACQGPLHRDDLEPQEKPVYHPRTDEESNSESATQVAFKKARKMKVEGLRKLTAD